MEKQIYPTLKAFKSKALGLQSFFLHSISLLLTTAGTFTLVATIFVIALQTLHFIESNIWVNFTTELLFDKCYCPLFTHEIAQKIGLSGILFITSMILLPCGYLASLIATTSFSVIFKANRTTTDRKPNFQ